MSTARAAATPVRAARQPMQAEAGAGIADLRSNTLDLQPQPEPPAPSQSPEPSMPLPRIERVPFGAHTQKLARPAREGFRRYWFNDVPGRIDAAKAAGYSHVLKDGKPETAVVSVRAGGGGLIAYHMEIPLEWYNEDFARTQQGVDEIDAVIKRGRLGAKDSSNRYVPAEGIKYEPRTGPMR